VDRAIWIAAAPSDDDAIHLHAVDLGERATLGLAQLPPPVPGRQVPRVRWSDYPAGVAWVLFERGFPPIGLRAVYGGDLPMNAGVSSSAAVEVAFLLAWQALGDFELSRLELAQLGRRVENEYLGIQSGIMDQYACLNGERGHVILLDCRDLSHQLIPMPRDLAVLVVDSGVPRGLAESGFNQRRVEGHEALTQLRRHRTDLGSLRDVESAEIDSWGSHLPDPLEKRVRHVIGECARVVRCADCLRSGDIAHVAALIRASHESSRDLYEVSIPELDVLAEAAWSIPGCHGARLSGGGFGGCVTALVDESAADRVSHAMGDAFEARFQRRPSSFVCHMAKGATVEEVESGR
jgi:galactokinase